MIDFSWSHFLGGWRKPPTCESPREVENSISSLRYNFSRICRFWWAHFERTVLSAHWAVCAHIWRGFRAWRGKTDFGLKKGLFLRGSLKSRLGSGGIQDHPSRILASSHHHNFTQRRRWVGKLYVFGKYSSRALQKVQLCGAVTLLRKVTKTNN